MAGRSASIWARAAGSCSRQRSTSQVRPGTPTALMTTLSLIGHSRGRLRASSLVALAVPMPSIAVSASHSTSIRRKVSSPASHRSVSCGRAASIRDSRWPSLPSRVRTTWGRQVMSSSATASRSSAMIAPGGLRPRSLKVIPAKPGSRK